MAKNLYRDTLLEARLVSPLCGEKKEKKIWRSSLAVLVYTYTSHIGAVLDCIRFSARRDRIRIFFIFCSSISQYFWLAGRDKLIKNSTVVKPAVVGGQVRSFLL